MSLLFPRQQRSGGYMPSLPPLPTGKVGSVHLSTDSAMRHSAVWACLRMRADLISTFPTDVYRRVGNLDVSMPKPPVLVTPGGDRWDYVDWCYASQVDLDRAGNTIGVITELDGNGLPARVDLASIGDCTVIQKESGEIRYRIRGREYTSDLIWHERAFVVAGLPVGLSPIAYAALSIGEYLSIQDFALAWFGGDGTPKQVMMHKSKTVPPRDAMLLKERVKAAFHNGETLVHGNDWEFSLIKPMEASMAWIEARRYGLADICRFFGCPAELIEATVSGQSVTYANVFERNLQYLIHHIGPAVVRREKNLSKLLPAPRRLKMNTDALLRMDPKTRVDVINARIEARTLTNSDARALENQLPLTAEEIAEFATIYGAPRTTPTDAKS